MKNLFGIKKNRNFFRKFKKEKLINFETNNDQLFSIIKNYELYKLLEKDLSKNKFFRSKFSIKKFIFFNKYELIINCDSSNFITKRYFSKKILKNIIVMHIQLLLNMKNFK